MAGLLRHIKPPGSPSLFGIFYSMTIKFTIEGNHEDRGGNPIPKIKKTAGQQWTPAAQRYVGWKEYVQREFGIALGNHLLTHPEDQGVVMSGSGMVRRGAPKPIALKPEQKAHMAIKIYWKNRAHPDPENVFGSIADAIFQNDNALDGSFEAQVAEDGKGRVEVEIKIEP